MNTSAAALFFSILLGIGGEAVAQGSSSSTGQTATTEAGRKVILRSDGTWSYTDAQKTAGDSLAKGSLIIEAGLVFNSGDVKPVARADIVLLDASLASIATAAKIDIPITDKKNPLPAELAVPMQFGFSLKYDELPRFSGFRAKILEALRTHVAYSVTTDFSGKAQLDGILPGKYFLLGYSKAGDSVALWHWPIEIGHGQTKLTLDNKNASVY